MTHPLVDQLRFTRAEFARGWKGIDDEAAQQRIAPMNCISWIIGHLACQEQAFFLNYGQWRRPFPALDRQFGNGAPASTPALDDVVSAWRAITADTEDWLDTLTAARLQEHVISQGKPIAYTYGNMLQRTIYHYWYHNGEIMAIRQLLGHERLPQFVGAIDRKAPYRPDEPA